MKDIDISRNQNEIIELIQTYCKERVDTEKLINTLLNLSDFFTAPASTKFHLSTRGGLAQHSLDVYHTLENLATLYDESIPKTSLVIAALFHDLCKVNFYKKDYKNVKIGGSWTTTEVYVIDDQFPTGHGEKSVIMLLRLGFRLTDAEIYAIRWHMGGFDNAVKGGEYAIAAAQAKTSLVGLLQAADIISSSVLER